MKAVFNQQLWKINNSGKIDWWTVNPVSCKTADIQKTSILVINQI